MEPNGKSRTAILEGTQEQIEQAAQAAGLTPRYIVVTDDGEYADFESGPTALTEVLRHTKGPETDWEDLGLEDQEAILWAAASSPQWVQGNIDPHQLDRMLESRPELAARLNGG